MAEPVVVPSRDGVRVDTEGLLRAIDERTDLVERMHVRFDRAQLAAAREAAVALARQWSWPACTQAYRDVYGALYDRRRPADSPGAGRA